MLNSNPKIWILWILLNFFFFCRAIYILSWWYVPCTSGECVNWNRCTYSVCMCLLGHFSRVWLLATLWTVACQAPRAWGFSRQGHWSGLPHSPPGGLPNTGIEPASLMSPALARRFFTTRPLFYKYQLNHGSDIMSSSPVSLRSLLCLVLSMSELNMLKNWAVFVKLSLCLVLSLLHDFKALLSTEYTFLIS